MIPRLSVMIRPPDPGLEPEERKEEQGVVAAPPPPVKDNQQAHEKSPVKVPTKHSIQISNNSKGGKSTLKFRKTWLDEVQRRSKGE